MKTTTLQLRIDQKTKTDVQKIINKMGLDMSSAVTLFLRQIIVTKSIPFQIRTVNGFTSTFEKSLLEASEETMKNNKTYSTAKEAIENALR
jgi:DNA-damage-inducible protein J